MSGYVQYLESDAVEIIAEGQESDLTNFIEEITVSEYPIDVQDMNVTWQEPTGEYKIRNHSWG
ncbi:acylphosphatase [Methanospirillum hungatei]|uniref:acylphosphatase n=1 Tax=Methanospirillum hungatei TaxID=2203 RepID=UPI002A19C0AD|nr:acylphosphatase [Methanospirillum hungatei]